jgi:hypothetical protein
MERRSWRWQVVQTLGTVDGWLDQLLYRPAVVKLFTWLPRWWLCDLARLSIALDDRWGLGYWDAAGIAPGGACQACGRRAAIHVFGGLDPDDEPLPDDPVWFLDTHPVHLCGWCSLPSPIQDQAELDAMLKQARARSVTWS